MTLSFQTKWPERMGELAGEPNYFVEKIWDGLHFPNCRDAFDLFRDNYIKKFGQDWDSEDEFNPKLHTIRLDPHNRWKQGTKIHFVINNRTKDRFQFAPVIECMSVQKIEIVYRHIKNERPANAWIDGRIMSEDEIEQLSLNDGFPSVEAFFQYFNGDFSGKIIHFTDLKY